MILSINWNYFRKDVIIKGEFFIQLARVASDGSSLIDGIDGMFVENLGDERFYCFNAAVDALNYQRYTSNSPFLWVNIP